MIRYDFSGRVALVTGSSRGIGAAIATAFSAAGATTIVHYWNDPSGQNRRDAEELVQQLQAREQAPPVHLLAADVREAAEVEALMRQVQERCGGLDILVNNAGILRDRSLRKMTLEDWHAVLRTNLDGVFYCCKYAVDILREGGRIVNIASVAGLVGFHGQTNYAAAKAGVIGLTRVLAKELARRQITVNAVAPGVIQTAMLGELRPEVLAEYLKQIPVGRLGTPQDVAHAVLFLASDESSYITGQVLPVTGGWI
ncbi:MAG: 3-oxoacyl-ACP reductase FabG [Thermogemmata sp.]|jgi:3-oxoacyl-[acyl-carrier protein] reductase|uniref:3-oxoacyl-ACP reductase FabG n=1 Tax=Thermogemmata fonticola TaxID=2755323 RepID=A0A7V8VDY5_9BACT|nr:3-oxoacyl-ACP reductase FabG [Thermogemmata fonticola]MBA2226002.1 3-oxoacyl-ACP reductase FabG [Thermogemmata fonticola]MCX8139156.1 3-oxoacyl-ACP reductase FabG [Gemmataceae bacterium]